MLSLVKIQKELVFSLKLKLFEIESQNIPILEYESIEAHFF